MRYDIRHAALAADAERRVRLAVRALGGHDVETSLEPWQGSGCAAVVVDADDGYGRHVMDVATRRGVAVLALGEASADTPARAGLPRDASIAAIAQGLQRLLMGTQKSDARRSAGAHDSGRSEFETFDAAGLVMLARTEAWKGRDLEARFGPRVIYLMRADGRALARTLSDLIEARQQLCHGDWQFREIDGRAAVAAQAEVTTSLDTLLVQAALRGEAQLPRFPDGACSLAHWPDLGAATDALDAMRVAAPLLRRSCTPAELCAHVQLDATRVHACLWAFDAAGLLTRTAPRSSPPVPATIDVANRSLWSRFAARFGLGPTSISTLGNGDT